MLSKLHLTPQSLFKDAVCNSGKSLLIFELNSQSNPPSPPCHDIASGFIIGCLSCAKRPTSLCCNPNRNHVKPQSRSSDGAPSPVAPVPLVDGLTGLRSPQPSAGSGTALATSELSPSFTHLTASEPSDDSGMANRGRSVGSPYLLFLAS